MVRVCRVEQYRIKRIVHQSLLQFTADTKSAIEKHSPPGKRTYGKQRSSPEEAAKHTRLLNTLSDLLDCFDFVLREDYYPEHSSLPTILREPGDEPPKASSLAARSQRPRRATREELDPPEEPPTDDSCNLSCDFCGADIFQSFFQCYRCSPEGDLCDYSITDARDDDDADDVDDEHMTVLSRRKAPTLGDGLILCPGCYAEGRTCKCGVMHAAQCRSFSTLMKARNDAATALTAAAVLLVPDAQRTPHATLTERCVSC